MIFSRKSKQLLLEILEDRTLPALHPFALISHSIQDNNKAIHDIQLTSDDFKSKNKQVLLAVKVSADAGSTLDPGRIDLMFSGKRNVRVVNSRSNLGPDRSSYLLVNASFGSYRLGVSPEGLTNGAFNASFALAGDVDGNFVVNTSDLKFISRAKNSRRGDSKYDPAADLDQDGRVTIRDYLLAIRNLGTSTRVRPVSFGDVTIEGAQELQNTFRVRQTTATLIGHATPKKRVFLDQGADGSLDQSVISDAQGNFSFSLSGLISTPTSYRLQITDKFGQNVTHDLSVTKSAVSIISISPSNGTDLVSLTRETVVRFDDAIDPATVNNESFYLVANGEKIPGIIRVSENQRTATFFYSSPLPESTNVRVTLDGNQIKDMQGFAIDADNDGIDGGRATAEFSTLPLTLLPGTRVWGVVRSSYERQLDVNGQPVVDEQGKPVFKPIAGVTISLDANPAIYSVTDAKGNFELGLQDLNNDGVADGLPTPEFFVHIDGSTAMGAPEGTVYATLGKPFHALPGQRTQLIMDGTPFDIYLPTMAESDVVPLNPAIATIVGLADSVLNDSNRLAELFPNLTPAQRALLSEMAVTFPAGSARDANGTLADRGMIVPVNPQFLPAPLPPNVTPGLVVSIQAGTAAGFNLAGGNMNFDTPAPVTFPNLEGLAPGEKSLIWSFDHDAGKWIVIGTGTVSADGKRIVSDAGVGVLAPGWHFTISGTILDVPLARSNFYVCRSGDDFKFADNPSVSFPLSLLVNATSIFPASVLQANVGLYVNWFGGTTGNQLWTRFVNGGGEAMSFPNGSELSNAIKATDTFAGLKDKIAETIQINIQQQANGGSIDNRRIIIPPTLASNRSYYGESNFLKVTVGSIQGTEVLMRDFSASGTITSPSVGGSGSYNATLRFKMCDDFGVGLDDISDLKSLSVLMDMWVLQHIKSNGVNYQPFEIDIEIDVPISGTFTIPPGYEDIDIHIDNSPGLRTQNAASTISLSAGFGTTPTMYYRIESSGVQLAGSGSPSTIFNQVVLPANKFYTMSVYQPSVNRSISISGISSESGKLSAGLGISFATDSFTGRLDLADFGGDDQDNDGVPDVGEYVIGTNPNSRDSDNDGISDDSELTQGLNPLDGVAFPTGVISSLAMSGTSNAVTVANDLVYIATGEHGLAIVNGSRFDRPIIMGQLDLEGYSTDVAVDAVRQMAAVASGNMVHIVDVSDPMMPTSKRVLLNATEVEAITDYFFVAAANELHVLDSRTGILINSLQLPGVGIVSGLAREGNRLFAYRSGILCAIDISSPYLPQLLGQTNIGINSGGGLFVGDNTAWLAGSGLRSIDVSNPAAMTLIGQPQSGNDFFTARQVALNGSGLALITPDGGNTVTLHDVSDRTQTGAGTFLTSFTVPGQVNDVAISRGIAYVAAEGRLEVINYRPFDSQSQSPTNVSLAVSPDQDVLTQGVQISEGGILSVLVGTRDDVQVRSVELLVNGSVVQSDVAFPFDFTVLVPAISQGGSVISLQARATDTGGNSTLSDPIIVNVVSDIFAPTITEVSPVNGAIKEVGLEKLSVRFSERMNPATLIPSNFSLVSAGADNLFGTSDDSPIPIVDFKVRDVDSHVQVTTNPLPVGRYEWHLNQSEITDVAGNVLGTTNYVVAFQTVIVNKVVNGGFNTGNFLGWEVEFSDGGNASIMTDIWLGSETSFQQYHDPYEGSHFAYLDSFGESGYTKMRQVITASPGEVISGYACRVPFFFTEQVGESVIRLMQDGVEVVRLYDSNTSSEWVPWSYEFTEGGVFTLEARVATNFMDAFVSLAVDGIKLTRN